MNYSEFRRAQDLIGLTNQQMADILCVSLESVKSYRTKEGPKKRNIPKLVEKVIYEELTKRGITPDECRK